ncbi:sensor histidine kinase RegB [Falsirhodobacter xinxiangensis]|uniref:sensor histidine kinase RegB n=1 Tax=Falsirhodobacter xinxiangensis TaxID=2530049 RepID=UPI0010AAB9D0|nr:ActS/PrrB/RegB family redox-sensitive histidine kinase [Rhodobacter xinxiangensis]
MTSHPKGLLPRGDWLRLRTLITLRWMTIAGQLAAITYAYRVLDVHLPISLCYLAVVAAICANLASAFAFPGNRRLTETEAMLTLIFDMVQLTVLIYLTGGLSNPFVLLILAPVVISASALGLATTIAIAVCAAVLVSFVTVYHLPMELSDGSLLVTPQLFTFGFWLSMVIGIGFTSVYARQVSTEIRSTSNALLATQMALAREQKLTDLGGVVAAAAHELGTPLATIKLVSAELMEELKDHPDLAEDAALIRDQANRCRDILQSMGRAGKDDPHMRQAPLSALLRDAAEPHLARGKAVEFTFLPLEDGDERMPTVLRSAELIHGLRNLIQNAVDFSRSTVWIDGCWDDETILVRIVDDGSGFSSQIIGRIGEPFVRSRRTETRPEYEGMGLGLFIAKTLLERTGARLRFANAADPFLDPQERLGRSGAVVEVIWPRDALEPEDGPLGDNLPFG